MARKIKVQGHEFIIETNEHRTHARLDDANGIAIGNLSMVLTGASDGAPMWKADARCAIQQPTMVSAAQELARLHLGRTQSIERAHEDALAEVAKQQRNREHRERIEAQEKRRAEESAQRRATLPMLTVLRAEYDSYSLQVGDPYRVVVYGDPYTAVEVNIQTDLGSWRNPDAKPTRSAGVNWSAFGSVTPQTAREYALAILRAADEAETFNRSQTQPTPTQSDEVK